MKTVQRDKPGSLFNGTVILGLVLGSLVLIALSFFQKVAAGFNPYVWKAYAIPTLFGGFSGMVVGSYVHKLKSSSRALQESEEKYRSIMASMTDAIYICSADFLIEYANPTMVAKIGRNAVGEACYTVLHDFDQQCPWCCHEQVMQGDSTSLEIVSPRDNRSYLVSSSPVSHTDGSVSKLTVLRDVTDIRNMEKQLQQSQKMEAIGTLAGGIAHDFNNILAAVIGYTELLQMALAKESAEFEYAHQIQQAGNRAKNLVKQILAFSRQTEHERKPVDVSLIVKEVTKLLRSSLPTTIEIKQQIQGNALVMGDSTQIHQILMNLGTNAGHAMQDNGGLLSIELGSIELKAERILQEARLKAGMYVRLRVSDTGHGMPADIVDRVFDPFYTTKQRGEGTGLGLSVVHGIVTSYEGAIEVCSEPGQGTTFTIYLPAIEKGTSPVKAADREIPQGNEHILFVDDEVMLVQMGTSQLEALGYRVSSRTSSREALALFKSKPADFDLVITDMTMPEMTGDKLASQIKQIRPEIPIILCTGFGSHFALGRDFPPDVDAMLMKPVIMRQMAQMVRQSLDRES